MGKVKKMKKSSEYFDQVNEWLTTRQVAEKFNINYMTLLRWRYSKPKRGFPYHVIGREGSKFGGHVRYHTYEIGQYLKRNKK